MYSQQDGCYPEGPLPGIQGRQSMHRVGNKVSALSYLSRDMKVLLSSTFIQHQDNNILKPKRTLMCLPKCKELGYFYLEQGRYHAVLSSEIS